MEYTLIEKEKNKPIDLFYSFSTYNNTEQINPFSINTNNLNSFLTNRLSAENINKELICKKGSSIDFYFINGGSFVYDYLPREIYVYSSNSESFTIDSNINNICGRFILKPIALKHSLPNTSWYSYPFFETAIRFNLEDDLSLGTSCQNFFIGFLIRICPIFKVLNLGVRNIIGNKFRDNYYWLNFKFGEIFSKTMPDTLTYDDNTEIMFNLNFSLNII